MKTEVEIYFNNMTLVYGMSGVMGGVALLHIFVNYDIADEIWNGRKERESVLR